MHTPIIPEQYFSWNYLLSSIDVMSVSRLASEKLSQPESVAGCRALAGCALPPAIWPSWKWTYQQNRGVARKEVLEGGGFGEMVASEFSLRLSASHEFLSV